MKYRIFTFALIALLQFSLHAKQLPPVGAPAKDFSLPQTLNLTLDNGLKVTLIDYGNTPKVTLRLVTKTGNVDDGELQGVADLAYQLLTEGTSSKTALDIAQQAADMGGQVINQVGTNSSYLQLDVLSEFVGDAALLLGDLVLNSQFAEDDLAQAKANILRKLRVQRSEPQSQVAEAFNTLLFAQHPYAVTFPDEARFSAINPQQAKSFITQHLVAKRSHLYISGKFDHAVATSAVQQAFAALAAGNDTTVAAPDYQGAGKLVFIDRPNAPQSSIRIGLPVATPADPDFIGLQLLNTMLGGAFSSRITANIRENKGYTYSPYSSINSRVNSSLWYETADITSESTAAALEEIIKEIRLLQNQAPSEAELNGMKSYSSGIYVLQNSTRTAIINQLWFLETHGLPLSRLESYVKQLNSLSAEDISALARKYLDVSKMSLVVVGDSATVNPQLAQSEVISSLFK